MDTSLPVIVREVGLRGGLQSFRVATEDVAYLFQSMGVATGLDVDALLALRTRFAHWLEGEPLHVTIWRAGWPKTMREAA